jgi:homoserine O-succinyltransferase/O-acetyltransferase
MPIKIPNDLPSIDVLLDEGVSLLREQDAVRQDIRPLQIAVLNLMPEKVKTETQLIRQLGRSPLQVELTLLTTASYEPRNAPAGHMAAFYKTWPEVKHRKFDGLVITGAPIERLEFEEVKYWPELTELFDWARHNVHGCYFLCWAGMAAVYHYYGVPKYDLGKKLSGVFPHRRTARRRPLIAGFDDEFHVPVSRWTEVRRADVDQHDELEVLAESDESGVCIVEDAVRNRVFVFNHFEYDAGTLSDEYARDVESAGGPGAGISVPSHYFPGDDPAKAPVNNWRSHAQLLYGNWLMQIYETTPYDIEKIGMEGS